MAHQYFDIIYNMHLSVIRRQKSTNNSIRNPITVRYLELGVVRYLEVAFILDIHSPTKSIRTEPNFHSHFFAYIHLS